MSESVRKVLHIDCDCFFAAVEMRENPDLAEVPLAIGGSSDRRGVIATCNYPARAYGVRSAMPTATALRLCPDLVLMPGNMALYRDVSEQIMEILRDFSPLLQQVSVDEAYLELAPNQQATFVAEDIRARVKAEVGITVSVGAAPNKFLAKIASDWNKPDGLFVVPPEQVTDFVAELPVGKIPGIGPAFESRLHAAGIRVCADVLPWSLKDLVRRFGRSGVMLYERARGQDSRPLTQERLRKSVSVEHTYAQDLTTADECLHALPDLYQRWQQRVERTPWEPEALAPFVKVKFSDFSQTTLASAGEYATVDGFQRLMAQALKRSAQPVRLLGIGGKFPQVSEQQLTLF